MNRKELQEIAVFLARLCVPCQLGYPRFWIGNIEYVIGGPDSKLPVFQFPKNYSMCHPLKVYRGYKSLHKWHKDNKCIRSFNSSNEVFLRRGFQNKIQPLKTVLVAYKLFRSLSCWWTYISQRWVGCFLKYLHSFPSNVWVANTAASKRNTDSQLPHCRTSVECQPHVTIKINTFIKN